MRIHKEGFWLIPVSTIIIGALLALLWWLIPFDAIRYILAAAAFVLWILVVRFFRDPVVVCPAKDGILYAPAEGKVVVIEKTVEEEYLKDERIQVSIFMSPLNVHVNRSPIAGVIEFFKYHPGKFLVAWHPKSSTENERTTVCIKTPSGSQILMRQIAGAVARRILFYPKEGDQVATGESVGFIRFGSRVDVFLPTNAEVLVKIGDLTKGGETELARIR